MVDEFVYLYIAAKDKHLGEKFREQLKVSEQKTNLYSEPR